MALDIPSIQQPAPGSKYVSTSLGAVIYMYTISGFVIPSSSPHLPPPLLPLSISSSLGIFIAPSCGRKEYSWTQPCLGAKGEVRARSSKCRPTEYQKREDVAVITTSHH